MNIKCFLLQKTPSSVRQSNCTNIAARLRDYSVLNLNHMLLHCFALHRNFGIRLVYIESCAIAVMDFDSAESLPGAQL